MSTCNICVISILACTDIEKEVKYGSMNLNGLDNFFVYPNINKSRLQV